MRLWPTSVSLIARIFAVLLPTMLIALVVLLFLYESARRVTVREDEARRAAEHVAVVSRMLEGADPAERVRIAEESSTEHFTLRWYPWPPQEDPRAVPAQEMRNQMLGWEPSLRGTDLRLGIQPLGTGREVSGALQLEDRSWLHFRTQDFSGSWKVALGRVLLTAVPLGALLLLSALLVRLVLRPLRVLAAASARVGMGEQVILPEQGPREFRDLVRAYNEMQGRITRMISDRTEALAAVGHDLRTPLARLRLGVDAVHDPEVRGALGRDISEMEAMLSSLLMYFAGDQNPERPQLVDVAVVAATLVDDLQDRGCTATYSGPDHLDVCVPQVDFKRALTNLVDNAYHYGDQVWVTVSATGQRIQVCVEDDGPGVPEESLERIREPFQRLDPARGRNTSGVGLGIPIALRVVQRAGGTLSLGNRPEGGFRAVIDLPRIEAVTAAA
jgi:two-component system, OmpR family, osmolarity sensor histidine kinase EnvZ